MKTFPGSSEQSALAPSSPAEPLRSEVKDKLAALATDDPLPLHKPARDRVRLLVQSPHKLLLYWSFRHNPFERLHRTLGDRATGFRFGVRLSNLTISADDFSSAASDATGLAGEHWFTARPAAEYKAEIGFLSPAGAFVRVLASDIVRTPRLTVAPAEQTAPGFRGSPAEFARVLTETGYERDAMIVRFEAAAANMANLKQYEARSTRPADESSGVAAPGFAGADDLFGALLLSVLAARESHDDGGRGDDFIATLPAELRARLQIALSAIDPARVRRLLLAALNPGGSFDFAELFAADPTEDFARTFSSFSLGTNRRSPARRDVWLPSLNHDQLLTLTHRFAAGSFVDE